ncbi:MAG: CDP-diacylglycerol--glycerol-3-phosphate 3-phosphatidyltransferase [Firmicutes bacterium]|nr:CDP-diacylglycerol--glycerol-3-phosphate 3-phosphatidyltransferase [Bacillota bacterium]MCL1954279.1 CDP-diacylglycerol--glycerol-3-phosphate 3-phosphatidyltransferase [Bacillota bacterium]
MNLPTKLTLLRILMIPAFVVFFLLGNIPHNRLIALIIFILAASTDFLDGWIARKYNLVTDLGKFLDPIADKLLVNSASILFVYEIYNNDVIQLCMLIITLIFVSRELIISAFRLIAVSKSVVLAADFLGKIKTVVQMIGIIVVLLATYITSDISEYVLHIGIVVLLLAALLSILSCANYIIKNKRVLITEIITE